MSARNRPAAYQLPDPELGAYDRGVGVLSLEGELEGYLASVVGRIAFPSRSPWPWFVVVWADGTKERSFEDCGPLWLTVRELDAGRFEHHGPSVQSETRFLGVRLLSSRPGPLIQFDFAWLPPEEAARKWAELRLEDADF